MLPFEEDLELLDTIPGIGRRTAEQILSETGTDVENQFGCAALVLNRKNKHGKVSIPHR